MTLFSIFSFTRCYIWRYYIYRKQTLLKSYSAKVSQDFLYFLNLFFYYHTIFYMNIIRLYCIAIRILFLRIYFLTGYLIVTLITFLVEEQHTIYFTVTVLTGHQIRCGLISENVNKGCFPAKLLTIRCCSFCDAASWDTIELYNHTWRFTGNYMLTEQIADVDESTVKWFSGRSYSLWK